MPKIIGNIPNFINGVSQQATVLRLPSQAEASVNYFPTVVNGLARRPRTTWLAKLLPTFDPINTFTHLIIRDQTEQYAAFFFSDGSIRVFDPTGTEHTVTNTGSAYLAAGTDPMPQKLKALTIADYTFVTNHDVVVTDGTAASPGRPYEALFYVQSGNYSKTYSITINGGVVATYTTPDSSSVSHEAYVSSEYIASQLYANALTTLVPAGYTVGLYGPCVYVASTTLNFTGSMDDGYGGRASQAVIGSIQQFSNLPTYGPAGFVVAVTGSSGNNAETYYAMLNADGIWTETVAPATNLGLGASTMPHTLTRNSDGTFTFQAATWLPRKCGDFTSVPDPSFVGQTIYDVLFFNDRLGFLTEANVVLSSSGEFYNFYRETKTTVLDTDPIDLGVTSTQVSLLQNYCVLQGLLLLFSTQQQFLVAAAQGNNLLTPATVSSTPLTSYINSASVRPVPTASSAFFISELDGYAQLYEMFLNKAYQTAEATSSTSHVPYYIPSGVTRLIASSNLDMAAVLTSGDPQSIYVYMYHYSGQDKVQSAWSQWQFPNAERVLDLAFDGKGSMFVLLMRGGAVSIETIRCEQKVVDSPLTFEIALDQFTRYPGSAWSYNAVTNLSTATLPYVMPSGMVALTDFGGTQPFGVQLTLTNPNVASDNPGQTTVIVRGNLTGQPFITGTPFESKHDLSPFFYSAVLQMGQPKIVQTNGRTQIIDFELSYSNSGYFRVEVQAVGRDKRIYEFNGDQLDGSGELGSLVVGDGRFSCPILSRHDRVTISLVNDSWLPSTFSEGQWRGTFTPSNRGG